MEILQVDESRYRDAVRGCWLGKNAGGTLGAPFEGSTEINDVSFYVQENLKGRPVPNDDLNLSHHVPLKRMAVAAGKLELEK